MDETTDLLKIKIEKAKEQLPKEASNAINAIDWKDIILGMREKKGYSFEQLETLELETELLLAGLLSPANYPKELETRMKLPSFKVNELVNELNETIFKKIREELIKNTSKNATIESKPENKINISIKKEEINTPVATIIQPKQIIPEQKTIETQVLGSAGIEIIQKKEIENKIEQPLEKREDMLAKVEKPELATPSAKIEIPAPVIETPSISASKLSGSFQLPSKKTEYSLQNISKTGLPTTTPTKPIAGDRLPKIDPYREPTE